MERGGRSAEERAEALEQRRRERELREQGPPPEEEGPDEERQPEQRPGWQRPDLGAMSRYGAGRSIRNIDVYTRRRLVALLVIVLLAVGLFLLLGGC